VSRERGQSSVEMVALLPLVLLVALVAAQALAAGRCRELAGHAAGAGASALLQGADARSAARDALPGWSRARLEVAVSGRRVRVVLRPPGLVPGLGKALAASAEADAGPAA
jgi:hypothetical protein